MSRMAQSREVETKPEDCGLLREHVVLEYLQACAPAHEINYWRDTSGREVDCVIRKNRDEVDAIECKWDPRRLEADALKAFRSRYPSGRNYLVCPDAGPGYEKKCAGLDIVVVNPRQWLDRFADPR